MIALDSIEEEGEEEEVLVPGPVAVVGLVPSDLGVRGVDSRLVVPGEFSWRVLLETHLLQRIAEGGITGGRGAVCVGCSVRATESVDCEDSMALVQLLPTAILVDRGGGDW